MLLESRDDLARLLERPSIRLLGGLTPDCGGFGDCHHDLRARTLEMPRENVKFEGSKRTDREIAQPQIGEAALLPDAEQRPVERLPDRVIALSDRDADAFTKIA